MKSDPRKPPNEYPGIKKKSSESFGFSRLRNSSGEIKAQTTIFRSLEKMKLDPEINSFVFSKILDHVLVITEIFLWLGMGYLCVLFWVLIRNFGGFLLWILFTIILLLTIIGFHQFMEKHNHIRKTVQSHLAENHNMMSLEPKQSIQPKANKKEKPTEQKLKNIEVFQKSEKNRKFQIKMAICCLLIPYNSFSPIKWVRLKNLRPYLLLISYGMGTILYGIKQFTYSIGELEFFSGFAWILNSMMIITILLFIFTESMWIMEKRKQKSQKDHDKGTNIQLALDILRKLQEIHPKIQWVDLQIVFTGCDRITPIGSMAFFQENAPFLEQYHDVYLFQIQNPLDNTLFLHHNQSIFNPEVKLNQIIKELLAHISRQHQIKYTTKTPWMQWYENYFYPPKIRHFFQNMVIVGEKNHVQTNEIQPISDEESLTQIQKLSDTFYHFLLTVDKRIDDKINSGE